MSNKASKIENLNDAEQITIANLADWFEKHPLAEEEVLRKITMEMAKTTEPDWSRLADDLVGATKATIYKESLKKIPEAKPNKKTKQHL